MTAPDRMRGLAGVLVLPAQDYQRDRRLWLTARRMGLGASETAAVLGLSAWATPLSVYLSKVDTSDVVDEAPSIAAQIGTDMEDMVARWTVREWPELGKIGPTPGLLVHPDHGWMFATLDRLLYPRGTTGADPLGVLEVKTTSRWNYEKNWVDGVPPAYVQVQVQQQLAVSGLDTAWVACWVRDDTPEKALKEPYRIDADPAVHAQLIEYAGTWWKEHVVAQRPPSASFADAPRMNELHVPNLDADPVVADDELELAVGRWLDAKNRAKAATDDATAAEVAMKDAMVHAGSNAIARGDGQLLVTWKANKPGRRLDTKALEADHPDLVARYKKTTPGAVVLRPVKGYDD
ncbi:YqaJ viral recombinase family protein [Brachybacterium rhamnosum]|uniref:Lambda-exonuclease family protein n=1 Tax=Brachybacterium rhamnosum TaxID=173361 RepID=A0ABW4Q1F7_9MICO